MNDINPDDSESADSHEADAPDEDITAALEANGISQNDAEDTGEAEEDESSGLVGRIAELSGTGKDLDSYENDPIAGIFAYDDENGDSQTPRGAKHIARGIDGLSPFAAAHPLIDIGVGFVLLQADDRADTSIIDGPDPMEKGEDGDDSHYRGDMTT